MFREAGTFIGVDGEMHRLLAYFDHPADYHLTLKMASAQDCWNVSCQQQSFSGLHWIIQMIFFKE